MASVMELCSSAIRGVIVAPPGKKLVVADLSNIEGRTLAWLAGEEWKLQAFRDYDTITGYDDKRKPIRKGHDLYNLAYAKSFGIQPGDVTKDQRQIGKVQELALGYAGGVGAFLTFAASYGIDLEELANLAAPSIPELIWEEALDFLKFRRQDKTFSLEKMGLSEKAFCVCESFKRLWREAHPATVKYWAGVERACIAAVRSPGVTMTCGRHKIRRDGQWLRISLPSGRCLCYPAPKLEGDDDRPELTYMGMNQYTRQWSRQKTYSGKLVENICQAVARDLMAYRMQDIDDAGYEIVLTVHDEIITETPDTPEFSAKGLADLMATAPAWADGIPLAAAGFEDYRYRKD